MKPINSYILERLNPRNLGPIYDFSFPFLIHKLEWHFETDYIDTTSISCEDWWCVEISNDSSHMGKCLVFYSENTDWIFYISAKDIEQGYKNSWAAYCGSKKLAPKELYEKYLKNNFFEYGQNIGTIPEFNKMVVDNKVQHLVNTWIKNLDEE